MLDTIREYTAERLVASGEADDVGRRHARDYCELAHERSSEGEAMSVDEAVAYALSHDDSPPDTELKEDADA
jgi:predicted ATPase